MSLTISQRLSHQRAARFVGRSKEIALFEAALKAETRAFLLLHVFGPGGIGKSSLLRRFQELATAAAATVVSVDAGSNIPSEIDLRAAAHALAANDSAVPVLLIDSCERLNALEPWLREEFYPSLPDRTLIVVASRFPPSAGMRSDPGWRGLVRTLSLRNLSEGESLAMLQASPVPEADRKSVVDFTHGHPLALALVADLYQNDTNVTFQPEGLPNLVHTLLQRFVDGASTDAHQRALEVCCLARVVTEPLLAHALPDDESQSLFEWLRSLSFVDQSAEGLAPHDMAREALLADLRWRNPERHRVIHERARTYYGDQIGKVAGAEQQALLQDYIFLHRDNPVVRPFFDWDLSNSIRPTPMNPGDVAAIVDMIARNEGPESAKIAQMWIGGQPGGATAFRDSLDPPGEPPAGFLQIVSLTAATPSEIASDPGATAAWTSARRNQPLREGESVAFMRFWMARDSYQSVSQVQSQIFVTMVRHWISTQGLAKTFLPCANPEFWSPLFEYGEHRRHAEADFTVGGNSYGMFVHDWRAMPPVAWLEVLARRETGQEPVREPGVAAAEVIVLSRDGFDRAVAEALEGFAAPNTLVGNPLIRSRTVVEKASPTATAPQRVASLRQLLIDCAKGLGARPKDLKLLRALEAEYFKPVGTQEQAAERLEISISSYRRHVKDGVGRLAEALWQREIGG